MNYAKEIAHLSAKKQEAENFLRDTDYMVIKQAETKEAIDKDVKTRRQECRDIINECRGRIAELQEAEKLEQENSEQLSISENGTDEL